MRTTIHIDDHLFAELKKRAADSGRTLAATIQDAVRESLPQADRRLAGSVEVMEAMNGVMVRPNRQGGGRRQAELTLRLETAGALGGNTGFRALGPLSPIAASGSVC